MTVIRAVASALERVHVIRDSSVLAAVSGGADSVAMLFALHELAPRFGYRLGAAHLNHRIRGDESDRDEAFVRDLCARLGVALEIEHAAGLSSDTPNLEETAREARQDFLRRAARRMGAAQIALAHTADDQAETVLMRLLRGAGIAGLGAMSPSGPGRIVRPMLALERATLERYLNSIGQSWIEDSSNTSPAMLRNRIRRELVPYLEREYASGLSRRLVELSAEMRAVDDYLTRAARAELSHILGAEGDIDLARFAGVDPALKPLALRLYLGGRMGDLRGITRRQLDAIFRLAADGPPNGSVALPRGWRAFRRYSRLTVSQGPAESASPFRVPIALDGQTIVAGSGYKFVAQVTAPDSIAMPPDQSAALFDMREITGRTLLARNFQPGDRIVPLGMSNSRKIKDVFIDRKIPRDDRARFPVIAAGSEILWLPGLIRANSALVTAWSEAVLRVEARPL